MVSFDIDSRTIGNNKMWKLLILTNLFSLLVVANSSEDTVIYIFRV